MSGQLTGKVVVVTGACGLLGQRFCRAVLAEGGSVVATDLMPDAPRQPWADVLQGLPQERLTRLRADITDSASLDACIEQVRAHHGRVDALVNNAYPRNKHYGRRFEEVTYPDLMENVGMHTGGYFLAAQRFLRLFKEQGHGNIVNLASIYGVSAPRFELYTDMSFTMPVEYAIIKSGIIHLTRYIASYHRGMGIRCNSISPGGIRDAQPAAFQERYRSMAVNKGMLDPDDVCGALVFLLSDASAYVNGQNLIVDDGWSL